MKRSARVWIIAILILGLVAVLVAFSRRTPTPDVMVYTVARGDIDASITTNGKVEPVAPYELRSLIESRVTAVHAVEGQSVKAGQLLATLDDAALQSELSQARSLLVASEDSLRTARTGGKVAELAQLDSDIRKTEVERTRLQTLVSSLEKLVAQQAATQLELTNERANLARADSDLQRLHATRDDTARESTVDASRLALAVQQSQDSIRDLEEKAQSARVVAPINGTLYSLPFKLNDFVHPGDLIAAVADLHHVRVRAFVDEPELGALEPGQTTVVTWDALPNRNWTGQTKEIPREVVARNTRSVGEVLCSVENSDQRLIPNINVNVRIEESAKKDVLIVPRGAVIFSGTHRYVFTIHPAALGALTTVERREIHVGGSNATNFEVLGGLSAGDEIALPGNIELKDKMRVQIAQQE